jgi:hypothetical protein
MLIVRLAAVAIGLLSAGAACRAQDAGGAMDVKVVLRLSRAFLVNLTRQQFAQDQPVNTTSEGATVEGTAHAAGQYGVALRPSDQAAEFDVTVTAEVTLQLNVTRRPVCVALHGFCPFQGSRRVAFDGKTFTAQPVQVGACAFTAIDAIDTFRHGPFSPLIRRVARPAVARRMPEASRTTEQEIRTLVGTQMRDETDRILEVLDVVAALHTATVKKLAEHGIRPVEDHISLAATEEEILAGVGFARGQPCRMPAAAGPMQAPVEIWVHHKLKPVEKLLIAFLGAEWQKRVKPQVRDRIAVHSPELAKRLDDVQEDLQFVTLAGDPDWLVIRFSRKLHTKAVSRAE